MEDWDEAGGGGCGGDSVSEERAVEEGLKYAERDAVEYEASCLLEPEEEKGREVERLRRKVSDGCGRME